MKRLILIVIIILLIILSALTITRAANDSGVDYVKAHRVLKKYLAAFHDGNMWGVIQHTTPEYTKFIISGRAEDIIRRVRALGPERDFSIRTISPRSDTLVDYNVLVRYRGARATHALVLDISGNDTKVAGHAVFILIQKPE